MAAILNGEWGCRTQYWKGSIQELYQLNFVGFGFRGEDLKIKTYTVRRTESDSKSSHGLWFGIVIRSRLSDIHTLGKKCSKYVWPTEWLLRKKTNNENLTIKFRHHEDKISVFDCDVHYKIKAWTIYGKFIM